MTQDFQMTTGLNPWAALGELSPLVEKLCSNESNVNGERERRDDTKLKLSCIIVNS